MLICVSLLTQSISGKQLRSGDIETNPGPTCNIEKTVQGSFHQGNERFGNTAGAQCACNSSYALCWT